MVKKRVQDLEKPSTWDFERPEVREPVKSSRVVVSVAFRRDDFELVSTYAERIGKRLSEFIREAAIEKAGGSVTGTLVYGSGSTGALWGAEQMMAFTLASGLPMDAPEDTLVATH